MTVSIIVFNISHLSAKGLWTISFLNELELICLHSNIAIVSTQLNDFNYCYLTLTILFNVDHLFADSEVLASNAI